MRKIFFIVLILISVGILGWLYLLCPKPCFTIASLKSHRILLQQQVDEHYHKMVVWYLASYISMVALSLPIATLMTIAGGMLFGVWHGAFFSVLGGTVGSILAFFAVRFFIGDWLQRKYAKQLRFFNEQMNKYGSFYLLGLHFVSLIPFTLINLLAGLTNVHWWTFVWTTAVGMVPMTFLYAAAGQELNSINSIVDLISIKFLLIIGTLTLLAFLPVMFKSFRVRKG